MTLEVVTGAFSYTGRHIAEALLERPVSDEPPLVTDDFVEWVHEHCDPLARSSTPELARNIR